MILLSARSSSLIFIPSSLVCDWPPYDLSVGKKPNLHSNKGDENGRIKARMFQYCLVGAIIWRHFLEWKRAIWKKKTFAREKVCLTRWQRRVFDICILGIIWCKNACLAFARDLTEDPLFLNQILARIHNLLRCLDPNKSPWQNLSYAKNRDVMFCGKGKGKKKTRREPLIMLSAAQSAAPECAAEPLTKWNVPFRFLIGCVFSPLEG